MLDRRRLFGAALAAIAYRAASAGQFAGDAVNFMPESDFCSPRYDPATRQTPGG